MLSLSIRLSVNYSKLRFLQNSRINSRILALWSTSPLMRIVSGLSPFLSSIGLFGLTGIVL